MPGSVTLDLLATGPDGEVAVVRVSGEIDLRTADELRNGLAEVVEAGFGRIIVDFADVRFCDATGLSALVATYNKITERGGTLRLAQVRAAQRRIFRITGLDRLLTLHDTVDAAVRDGQTPSTAAQG